MTKQMFPNKKKILAAWSTRDLLVTAAISVVFAVLLLGATYLTIFIIPFGPLAISAFASLWLIPPIFIVYILRRPGAAILAQAMISILSVPFSPYGWAELMYIPFVSLPIELVFLATRYRNYRLPILVLAAIIPNLITISLMWMPIGINLMSIGMQVAILASAIISGGVGALLAKLLADRIAKTGVLSSYNIGKDLQKEV